MVLYIDDWVFDIDMEATMEYSAKEAAGHCDCGYCRNFYAAVDATYPNLRPFLAQFGVDIEAPDELMPFDATLYLACYCVQGKIIAFGEPLIYSEKVKIMPQTAQDAMINSGMHAPYFVISAGPMHLPWVLEESAEDVISPANEPTFLRKMWNKLLGKKRNNLPPS